MKGFGVRVTSSFLELFLTQRHPLFAWDSRHPLFAWVYARCRKVGVWVYALKVEEIGPTSAEVVQAKMEHQRFIESLGG
jgi:hypothetical protein